MKKFKNKASKLVANFQQKIKRSKTQKEIKVSKQNQDPFQIKYERLNHLLKRKAAIEKEIQSLLS